MTSTFSPALTTQPAFRLVDRIIIHSKVYDVSEWQLDHPGGADVLKEYGGKDASKFYDAMGHSEDAHSIRETFCVGTLESTSALSKL
jgi:cytochrome b involved in lipid metabolism